MCPSCGAKRAAEAAAFLIDEVVEEAALLELRPIPFVDQSDGGEGELSARDATDDCHARRAVSLAGSQRCRDPPTTPDRASRCRRKGAPRRRAKSNGPSIR